MTVASLTALLLAFFVAIFTSQNVCVLFFTQYMHGMQVRSRYFVTDSMYRRINDCLSHNVQQLEQREELEKGTA